MKYPAKKLLLAFFASCLLATIGGTPLFGQGGIALDFSTDPAEKGIEFFGTSEWRQTGGVEDSGYLSVTDAVGGQKGSIVFPDLSEPQGTALESFQVTADLRVGAGTADPADGFSFNLVRPDDPLIEDGDGYAASPAAEANLPEEGSTTGLAIGFDEWQSGPRDPNENGEGLPDPTCPDTLNDEGLIGWDCIGMSIRVDNILVGQAGFPVKNGDVLDDQSLQTGPRNDGVEGLSWAKLVIRVTADDEVEGNSNLFVSYKDRVVFDQSIEYSTSPGQLVFGGRTGGSTATHDIDNINIVTDFTGITLGDFNKDGNINLDDYSILLANMDTGGEETKFDNGDINFTGNVDMNDFVEFRREYLAANPNGPPLSAVPEPSASLMALFGILGLVGLRRRRTD